MERRKAKPASQSRCVLSQKHAMKTYAPDGAPLPLFGSKDALRAYGGSKDALRAYGGSKDALRAFVEERKSRMLTETSGGKPLARVKKLGCLTI